ncbi:MAG: TetR/AcrR family transcriptional regulator, partial [Clostridiales bacterium]|nr:TetR/AcrR family transcriptional regulator [Clostridiales bacterium]
MYKNCQREQSIQRQNHIVRTFMSLLDRQSYHEITVAELCRAAGVPRKAFYRYFDTREDIIRFMVDAVVLAYFRMENRPEQN